eukprot:6969159-Pyramimonas_sp.AAC.1
MGWPERVDTRAFFCTGIGQSVALPLPQRDDPAVCIIHRSVAFHFRYLDMLASYITGATPEQLPNLT